ncbi:uncharacterized protein LOC120844894 [Ixodes scapularis]|uniref:uncharacterized protein LOC120844894 n=1 Tax=Ixodes scapularis TaxID=6945 RepID=UPI001A9E644E|nr:uncharacterized protein LOC120844894 [Ixodes scapularis]
MGKWAKYSRSYKEKWERDPDFKEDCVGIGTDGASVMCGRNNSLFTRMKEVNSVRCVCHSLRLACNEVVSVLPTQVDFLVRECFNWFAHSPKRQQEYHAVFAAINSGDRPKKLVGLSGTRWLSIAGAIRTVLDQWVELKTHFEFARTTERCYTAKVLSDMFNDDLNLLLVKFLSPIIDEFDRMNKLFQSENPDPSKLYSDLLSFVKCLMLRVVLPNHASPGSNWVGSAHHGC